jgi:dipeptidyl aminopeptidase/acylaminoacyl peptidase
MPILAPLTLLALLVSAPASAEVDPLQARIERAHQHFQFPQRIRDTLVAPQWLRDADRFVFWSAVGPHAGTWVLADAQRRTLRPLLTADALQKQLTGLGVKPGPLPRAFPFAVAPDQQSLHFALPGRAFSLRLSDGHLTALPETSPAALALSPGGQASPDLRYAASQRGPGFAVTNASGRTLVERKGAELYEWQVPPKAWSPDGRSLAVWRNDARRVHKIPIVDYTSALEKVTMVPYTKTGTPLVRSELSLVEPASGRVTRVAPAQGEVYEWLAGWRSDGREALVLRLSRDGKRLELWAIASRTGKARLVLREERKDSFVGALDFATEGWARQVTPLADDTGFLWMSERDGWRHVYRYDYSGKLVRQVTRGEFPVHEVVAVAPGGDALYLLASAESASPYERLPYRVPLAGGALQRLSPEPGIHRFSLSPSGAYFWDAHSTRERPRSWDVRSTQGGEAWRYAQADVSALAELKYAPPEPFTATATDGTAKLYGVLYKPRDFDPAKRYPVIDYIYAGPFITVVPWNFVGDSMSMDAGALAQLGFVVMLLDARGTPGRSKAFQDANYGRVGQTEIPDHVAALKQAAASRPYMDLARAGIYGHSWGGYFALRGMLTAPDFFKAGYAGAPGALEEEAVINEPNLGLPDQNPEGYSAGSNLAVAGNLRGALKLMHGAADVNASLSTTMRMAQALIQNGKRFELLVMPSEGHSPQGPARRYYSEDVWRFFAKELGGPR